MSRSSRIGLALSAGGARGGYQVGVLKAYAEEVGHVDVLAGSSVGALNAVVLASAPSFREGVEQLQRIWLEEAPGLRLTLALASYLGLVEILVAFLLRSPSVPAHVARILDRGLFSEKELRKLLDEYVDVETMAPEPPVYVSIYESEGGLKDAIRWAIAQAGLQDTPDSTFELLQELPPEERLQAVLASAAVPLIFGSRSVGTGRFADGGIGGLQRRQGATPVDPLVTEACDLAFVSHLGDGSPWSRDDYPELTVVELRPRNTIRRGIWKDLLEVDREVLEDRVAQGYKDAKFELMRVLDPLRARHQLVRAEKNLENSEAAVEGAEQRRLKSMSRLDKW